MITWEQLARTDPWWVSRMIDRRLLDTIDLASALEALGRAAPTLAYPHLLREMRHDVPMVRESALLALTETSPRTEELLNTVLDLALSDRSSGVRLTAKEALQVITSPLTPLRRLQNWCARVFLVLYVL